MSDRAQVLIVDDEEQMLLAMETVLQGLGHQVLKARDGKEALNLLEKIKPDLVISDMRMPEMSGLELLAAIQKRDPQLPVVVITAYGTITQAVEAMQHGEFDFITKPFSADDLERVTSRVLRPVKRATSISSNKSTTQTDRSNSVAIVTNDQQMMQLIALMFR